MLLMGLDVGTSGCKALVIDGGVMLSQAYREYATLHPAAGWQELDPRVVWSAVKEVIQKAGKASRGDIRAISVSSFGEAFIPVAEDGRELANCMLYTDTRGIEEAAEINALAAKEDQMAVGAPLHPMYSLPKLLWLKKHRPDVYSQTHKVMLISGYILFKLGARPHSDWSLAARTAAFDVASKVWRRNLMDSAGIDPAKFCEVVAAAEVVGEVSRDVANELGLSNDVLLAAGGHDQPCAALGAGAITPGVSIDGLGTSECIAPTYAELLLNDTMRSYGFACVPHVVPELYITYAFTSACGAMLKWFRDQFGQQYLAMAAGLGSNVYELMIEDAQTGNPGLFVVPHFAGAATPYMDTEAKGAILGMDLTIGPRELIGAILEGITFEILVNAQALSQAGITVRELRVVGGLAQSERYLQLKADIMGIEIAAPDISEAGALGAAILAGVAAGEFTSAQDGVDRCVRIKRRYVPDGKAYQFYQQKFSRYQQLYPTLKGLMG